MPGLDKTITLAKAQSAQRNTKEKVIWLVPVCAFAREKYPSYVSAS
jgi:hypothetical protein